MLTFLSIKNFALVENCEINFSNGLNVISGETGAGKSIIIQALSTLLGGRASVEQIRTGTNEATLNGIIEIESDKLKDYFTKIGIELENNEIILKRVITSAGKSRSYINGNLVTSKEIEEITSNLFDFHGQHDGISLLKSHTHIGYLDNYSNGDKLLKTEELLSKISSIYKSIKETEKSINIIESNDKDRERKIELLKYEIEEIENSNIKNNEDSILKKEIKILENSEKLMMRLEELKDLFGDKDGRGIISHLKQGKSILTQISEFDNSFSKYLSDLEDSYYKLEDLYEYISNKFESSQFNPDKLDKLIERYEYIEKLKRKYGKTIDDINNYKNSAKKELENVTSSKENLEKLSNMLLTLNKEYAKYAISLSNSRKNGAAILEKKVKEELLNLGMDNVQFKIDINYEEYKNNSTNNSVTENNYTIIDNKKVKMWDNGIDVVEFLISPNQGEPLKPISKIASGGELSRLILALKSVLAESDLIETMIFDEIDVGIGGKVAINVSKMISKLSNKKQILCITHLPQIAANGESNILIKKIEKEGRTVTLLEKLDLEAKINEIARMLSGNITETSIKHAKELIDSFKL